LKYSPNGATLVWYSQSCILWLCGEAFYSLFSVFLILTKLDHSLFSYYILFFPISRPLLTPPGVPPSISIGLNAMVQLKCSILHEKFSWLALVCPHHLWSLFFFSYFNTILTGSKLLFCFISGKYVINILLFLTMLDTKDLTF
jgi:hypothetical protein